MLTRAALTLLKIMLAPFRWKQRVKSNPNHYRHEDLLTNLGRPYGPWRASRAERFPIGADSSPALQYKILT